MNAFRGCQSLQDVDLRHTQLRIIGQDAFAHCSSLAKIDFPDSLYQIGRKAFLGCSALETVALPSKVKMVRPQVFQDCVQLCSVAMHFKKCKVDGTAFANCPKLDRSSTSSTTLPSITELQHQVTKAKEGILHLSDRFEQDLLEMDNDLKSTQASLDKCRLAMESKNATIQQLTLENQNLAQQLQEERNKRKHPSGDEGRVAEPQPKRVRFITKNSTTDGSNYKNECNLM